MATKKLILIPKRKLKSLIDYELEQVINMSQNIYVTPDSPDDPDILLSNRDIHVISDFTNFTEFVTGSGSTVRGVTECRVSTGATAGSVAYAYAEINLAADANVLLHTVNFDKAIDVVFFGHFHSVGIAGTRYSWMRLANDLTGGDLAAEGFGFRHKRSGSVLYAQSHDGSNLENTDLGETTHSGVYRFHIKHIPGDRVEFYVNGSLKATHTTYIPAGSTPDAGRLSIGAENIASAVDQRASFSRVIVAQDW